MDSRVLAILISSSLYWYFNIHRNNRCITINPKCEGVTCYVATNKSDKETKTNNSK